MHESNLLTNLSHDNNFGPIVHNPNADFDFTLLFEQSILTIVPSVCFLLYAPARVWWLWREEKKASFGPLIAVKQVLYVLLLAARLSMLAFCIDTTEQIATAVPALSLVIAVVLGLGGLSFLEAVRSPRSSDAINVYLFLSIVFDAVQVRTLWLRVFSIKMAVAFSVCLGLKLVLLAFEVQGKMKWLLEDYRGLAPETLSGVFARRLFYWLNELLWSGYRALVKPVDLMEIKEEFASKKLLEALERSYSTKAGTRQRLWKSCFLAFKWDILMPILPRATMIALRYTQPFLFETIISYLQSPLSERNPNSGYGLIAATGLLYVTLTTSTTYYQHKTYQLVTKLRGSLVSLLYNRTLQSTSSSVDSEAPITLMSVDVDGFTMATPVFNEIWAAPIEIGIAVWLLKRQLGIVSLVPLGVALVCTGTAVFCSRFIGARMAIWNKATQQRVAATSSVLGSIKSIRMMGFTKYVNKDVQELRDAEIQKSKTFRHFTVFLNVLGNLPYYSAPVLTFAVFIAVGSKKFTVSRAFTSLSLISLLEQSAVSFTSALPSTASAQGCLKRLEEYLRSLDLDTSSNLEESPATISDSPLDRQGAADVVYKTAKTNSRAPIEPVFSLTNATLQSSADVDAFFTLRDITLSIRPRTFVAFTGPSGSGKTTLIKALLNRLPNTSSTNVTGVSGRIAYCAQTPWLPSTTIKEAIVGDYEWDEKWYAKLLESCALVEDIKALHEGGETAIGSQATKLSGGQRQRIALARALYPRHKSIVLDDILSGVDAKTAAHLCRTVFGREGILRELDATLVLATHSTYVLPYMDEIVNLSSDGRIQRVAAPGHVLMASSSDSSAPENQDPKNASPNKQDEDASKVDMVTQAADIDITNTARQTGDWHLYKHYILSVGWFRFAILLGIHVVGAFLDYFPTLWLKKWSSDAEASPTNSHAPFYLGIYGLASGLGLFSVILGIWLTFLKLVPASGRNLHNYLLHTVINAKQAFHDTTPTGATLNRFTQDMQHIDRDLPSATLRALGATSDCIAAAVLLSLSASYIATLIPLLLLSLYFLQRFYLRTSRQLRLLEIEARAPLFTIFQETVEGLDTLYAFRWQTTWKEKLFSVLDASQKPYYLLFCIQRWLILVLGFIVAAIAVLLVTFATQINNLSSPGAIGVGLMAILTFNDKLNNVVIEWTTLETSLGAIARLRAFSRDTPVEEDPARDGVVQNWPSAGQVEFRGVSATYRPESSPVLNDISFSIPAGSTCAIVGRTGSGKSSLLSTFMRLLPFSSGTIEIDGISHTSVPLNTLRSRVVCLPQHPYLLCGSIRRNLDPDSQLADVDMKMMLERVGLWSTFAPLSTPANQSHTSATLDKRLQSDAFSPGQVQLLVLARTLLLHTLPRILILDEATSNMDEASDAMIQRLIREEFVEKGCTVITIAHRLKTIVDFDQVIVLDAGSIVESGHPQELMRLCEDSVFGRMCREQAVEV